MEWKVKRYASRIDLQNPNQSWTRLIHWAGTGKRVLDVGCGRGQMGQLLSERFDCVVTGIEINPEFAAECRGYQQVLIGSAEDEAVLTSLSERFDIILCGDVLEHLRQPEIPLRAFHQLIAPGGRLLISVPNVAQVRLRLRLLLGKWDYTSEGIMDRTHLRWFTLSSVRAMVTEYGWRQEDFDYTVGPNFGRLLQRFPFLKKWLRPSLLASQFLLNLSATDA